MFGFGQRKENEIMAEEVGTIINAEIEGIKIVAKGSAESVKALLKLLSVLFGKEAAERRKARAQEKLTEAELYELSNKQFISEKLKRNPCAALSSDLQITSDGPISIVHLPKQFSKPGSAIALVCRDKGISIPEAILNNPIIDDRNKQIFKWLESNPKEMDKLNNKELNTTKLDYLRIKNGLPLVKNPVDDNPNDDFDCFMSRGQDLAFWADIEKSALKEYKASKEEEAMRFERIAKKEDSLSEEADTQNDKKQHKKNADTAREAKYECEKGILEADEIEKSGPEVIDKFAQKESVQKSIEDANAEKVRTGQHWEEKIDEAFKPVHTEDKVPESGLRYYAGKDGAYAIRSYEVEPPKFHTVLKDDGTEDEVIDPPKVASSYEVYDKNGKLTARLDERLCSPKQWKEEAIPELQSKLGLESAAVVVVGETKAAISPVDVDRAAKSLSEDAKTFNKEALTESKKTENFNKAATYEKVKNVGGNEKSAIFEAELSDGSKTFIAIPNDKDHIKKGEDGLFNITLNKDESYATFKKGDKSFKITDKTVKHSDIANLGSDKAIGKTPAVKKAPAKPARK